MLHSSPRSRRAAADWVPTGLAGALIGALGLLLAVVTDLTAAPQTEAAPRSGSTEPAAPLPAFDRTGGAEPVIRLQTPAQTAVIGLQRRYALTTEQQARTDSTVNAILQRRQEALRDDAAATEGRQTEIWVQRQREKIEKRVARDLERRIAEAEAAVAAARAEAEARRESGAEPPASAMATTDSDPDSSSDTGSSSTDTGSSSTDGSSTSDEDTATSSTPSSGSARLPVSSGVIGASFGAYGSWSRYHTGVDYRAGFGEPVYAATAGVVSFAGNKGDWAGNHVAIRHPDGISSMSSHLSSISVSPGQQVGAGQLIGHVGSTGRSFGPHLHFEVYPAGVAPGDVYRAVNPVPWLSGLGISAN